MTVLFSSQSFPFKLRLSNTEARALFDSLDLPHSCGFPSCLVGTRVIARMLAVAPAAVSSKAADFDWTRSPEIGNLAESLGRLACLCLGSSNGQVKLS